MQDKKNAEKNKLAVALKAMSEIESIVQKWEGDAITERDMTNQIRMVVLRYQGLMAPPIIANNL